MQPQERTATLIQQKLGITGDSAAKSFGFYCKVALQLPEAKIWLLVEQAGRGKNPGALFNHLARKELN